MIDLLFVGDGPRDKAILPPLVTRLLDEPVGGEFRHWAGLHQGGKGYRRKLLYAMGQTRLLRKKGLVAVVDRDKSGRGERFGELRLARDSVRADPLNVPTAIGEANPHAEAWLLDDPLAVRKGLDLPPSTPIPNVLDVHPKNALQVLYKKSPLGEADASANKGAPSQQMPGSSANALKGHDVYTPALKTLADIAKLVRIEQCHHREETGFETFANDVKSELGPLRGKST